MLRFYTVFLYMKIYERKGNDFVQEMIKPRIVFINNQ